MTVIGEVLELLKRRDDWKRIEAAPDRVDALEKRVAELEARLQRAPGEACPKCGALEFRTEKVEPNSGHFGQLGAMDRHLKCSACGHTEVRMQ